MARLTWTEPALRDLETIAEYIALDKPEAARAFVRKVYRVVERLAAFPKSGRVPPEIPDLPYREVVVPPCRVIYRIDHQTVLIIHVMRGEEEMRRKTFDEKDE
jgi:toxin ParE1/3/4